MMYRVFQTSFAKKVKPNKFKEYKGKGKGKVHPITGYEGPEGE